MRISKGETERAAGCGAVHTVGIAKRVGRWGGDHGNVDVHFAILDCLVTAPVRTKHPESLHFAFRGKPAEGAIHAAFDAVDRTVFKIFCQDFMAGE